MFFILPADPAPTTMKSYFGNRLSVVVSTGLDSGSNTSYWKKAMAATSTGMKTDGLAAAAAPTPTRGAAIEVMAAKDKTNANKISRY